MSEFAHPRNWVMLPMAASETNPSLVLPRGGVAMGTQTPIHQ